MKAGRTRKSRWPDECAICKMRMLVGQMTGQVIEGRRELIGKWVHVLCINEENRKERDANGGILF